MSDTAPFSVVVSGGEVWAVGQSDDAAHKSHPLVEHLNHGTWTAEVLGNVGEAWSDIDGVTIGRDAVWLVGSTFDSKSGTQHTVVTKHTAAAGRMSRRRTPGPATGFSAESRRPQTRSGQPGCSRQTGAAR